jgi:hybrid cluster-associated redox disulfide protein
MLIASTTRVEDVLRQMPQSSHVLVAFHTDCVGCHLARFCTLEEVSLHYHLDMQALIAALQASAPSLPLIVGEGAADEPQ